MENFIDNLKNIEILSTTPYVPYNKISFELISNHRLQKEFDKVKKIVKKSPLSSSKKICLLEVASLFGVTLKFKKYSKEDKVLGLCSPTENHIQIALRNDHICNKCTLMHEIGHIIQLKLGIFKVYDITFLSQEIELEQQAQAISFYLCQILWPKEKFDIDNFNCYFNEEDIIWLHNFYSDIKEIIYINDLFVFKNGQKENRSPKTKNILAH